MSLYVLDTSVFITAWRYYPFEDLWAILDELAREKTLFTADEVLEELHARQDEIWKWVDSRRQYLVHALTAETQRACRDILSRNPGFANPESTKPWADPFVIAEAKVTGATVVTQEHARGMNKIPAICDRENIPCLDMFGFFAHVGIRFSVTRRRSAALVSPRRTKGEGRSSR